MKVKYSSIFQGTPDYPGRKCVTINLSGCPLRCGWCNVPKLVIPEQGTFDEQDYSSLVQIINSMNTEALYLSGAEPLMQGNALLELCSALDKKIQVRVETSGFYPEELKALFPYVSYVSLDVKTALQAKDYAKITGYTQDPEVLLSKVLRSLAFLESAGPMIFKEIRTTIIPTVNDLPEVMENIISESGFADKFTLQQFDPSTTLSFSYKKLPKTSKQALSDLAFIAKKKNNNIWIRTSEGEVKYG